MKIKGYGETASIRLTHKGVKMVLENRMPVVYMENIEVEPSTMAFVEFKDTAEIDMLIYMLKEFKKMCTNEVESWKWRIGE